MTKAWVIALLFVIRKTAWITASRGCPRLLLRPAEMIRESFNLTSRQHDFSASLATYREVSNDRRGSKKSTTRLSTKLLNWNQLRERLALLSKKVSIVKCLMFLESST